MFEKVSETMKLEMMVNPERTHRYVLSRIWDKKKELATVVTIYPSSMEALQGDLTSLLIVNQLVKLGYGGFHSVNLFSKVGLKSTNVGSLHQAWDEGTDEVIQICAEKSAVIIFAWGSIGETNKIAGARIEQVKEKLQKDAKKWRILSDTEGKAYFHPLASKVRSQWNVVPYKEASKK
ncbi:DUF1643 domain-containing protein [Carnobacterium maltaromaticum]|uniref:DUF1643 domain-containing protein n=1 Tax=Carnobacterium maltaromaticum TaxID=2751 RepID=UPI003AFAA210